MARLEAVLYLAREPLNSRKLSQYANLADGTEARTLVGRLNQLYDRAGRAFRVHEVAGGMQLLTRPKFAIWLRRLHHIPAEVRLSAPAMETLAVVAYRQPVMRADIEAIRGVGCGEILRQLLERDLIRVAGRSDELGRPYLYGTSKRFLQLFGLRSIDELPRAEWFPSPEASKTGQLHTADAPQGTSDDSQDIRDSQVSVTSQTDALTLPASSGAAPPLPPPHIYAAGSRAAWEEKWEEEEEKEEEGEEEDYDFGDDEWEEDEDEDDEFEDEDEDEEEEEYDEDEVEESDDEEFAEDEWEEVEDEEEDDDFDEDDEDFEDDDYEEEELDDADEEEEYDEEEDWEEK